MIGTGRRKTDDRINVIVRSESTMENIRVEARRKTLSQAGIRLGESENR